MYFVHVYIYFLKRYKKKKKFKKKFQDFQIFPKKENFFQKKKNKKVFGLGALSLKSFKKKIKFFELGALDFLVTFSKKTHFFSFKDFKIL